MEELKEVVKEFIKINGGIIEEEEIVKKPQNSEITEVLFIYKGEKTIIQCHLNDIMKDIINKFKIKAQINNDKILFLFGGKLINQELLLKELIKDLNSKNNTITLIVYEMKDESKKKSKKKSNNIICPKCQELCLLKINENYTLKLFECKNGHITDNILLNEFNDTQYLYESKIQCDNCKNTNKSNTYNNQFYKCCVCDNNLCPLCKNIHDKSHYTIDYEQKDYICYKHNEKLISFCKKCLKNLCLYCKCDCDSEKDKTNNDKILFDTIMQYEDDLKKEVNNFKEKIKKFDENIANIINILTNVKDKISLFFNIYNNILSNYKNKNINYIILSNINEIKNNNIIKNINSIIDTNDVGTQFGIIVNIYNHLYNKNLFGKFEEKQFSNEVKYSNYEEISKLYKFCENNICRLENNFDDNEIVGNGFFVNIDETFGIPIKNALFTTYILPEEFYKESKYLNFTYKGNLKKINIENVQIFTPKNDFLLIRYKDDIRKIFIDKNLNYTCIEILNNDYIIKENELFKVQSFSTLNKEIISMHYPKGKDLSLSFGIIKNIINDEMNFEHNCFMDEECLGAPIINRNQIQNIIGIHSKKNTNFNLGNRIDCILLNMKNNYEFIKNRNQISEFNTIKNHSGSVNNIILLDNERLSSCSDDGLIIIYNLKTFEIIQKIQDKVEINYHDKLSNNNIIACCGDGTLKIYGRNSSIVNSIFKLWSHNSESEYSLVQILIEHKKSICKVIEINDNLIASCGLDAQMIIWENKNNSYNWVKTIKIDETENYLSNILKINDNEVVSVSTTSDYIKFWDLIKYDEKKRIEIKNIICYCNSMKMIDNILLISVILKGIYLINTKNYQYFENIIENVISMTSIFVLNEKVFISSEDDKMTFSLIEYKYKNKKLIQFRKKKKAHKNVITGLIASENGEIISCSKDSEIKFWI